MRADVDASGAVLHLDALRHAVAQLPRDVERAPARIALRRDRRQRRSDSASKRRGAHHRPPSRPPTGRRAATTPVTGVGVCHAASSTGRLPLARRRCVPARERIGGAEAERQRPPTWRRLRRRGSRSRREAPTRAAPRPARARRRSRRRRPAPPNARARSEASPAAPDRAADQPRDGEEAERDEAGDRRWRRRRWRTG